MRSFLLPVLVELAHGAPRPYVTYKRYDCSEGHGGTPLTKGDPEIKGKTLSECQALCDAADGCVAITRDQSSTGGCRLRSAIVTSECIYSKYDTYEAVPAPAPGPPAPTGQWAWMGGSPVQCSESQDRRCGGVYEGAEAWPGARCCSHTWPDQAADAAYVFGGWGYDEDGNMGYLNDLWRVDYANGSLPRWTFLGGSRKGGDHGGPEWPAGRHQGIFALDEVGRSFWVFSGQGVEDEYLPDVWRFDLETLRWQHKGNFSQPHSRYWSTFWAGDGRLWLLGGIRQMGSSSINDMWEFDYAKETWHEVTGPLPSARQNAYASTGKDGVLWLFGGSNYGGDSLTDLWRFDTSSRRWTFMGGNQKTDSIGTCTARGSASADALPTARHSGYIVPQATQDDHMFVFGGERLSHDEVWNDIWTIDLTSTAPKFAFGAGSCNTPNVMDAVRGTKGVPSVDTVPDGRWGGNGWVDKSGAAWFFGGGPSCCFVMDLWRFSWDDASPEATLV